MARSSGARPKKAVREQVAALKARLGTITSDRWQAAQAIMDEIVAVCGVHGPSGATMVPRACRVCHYYGHTRQFCPVWAERKARMSERELEELDAASGYVPPRSELECPHGPAQWALIQDVRAIEARREEGIARGLGCAGPQCKRRKAVTCASDVILPADCGCSDCSEWSIWMSGSQTGR